MNWTNGRHRLRREAEQTREERVVLREAPDKRKRARVSEFDEYDCEDASLDAWGFCPVFGPPFFTRVLIRSTSPTHGRGERGR